MNAVVFHRHGGADTLVYEEAPLPTVGPGDVLVRVKACALNHLDIWIREGIPAFTVPLPHIGGSDVAGIVERVGAGVTGVGLGASLSLPASRAGRANSASQAGTICARPTTFSGLE